MLCQDIELRIKNILQEKSFRDKLATTNVGLEDDLRSTVGFNSLSFVTLVTKVETEFGFKFPDEDLEIENFRNLKSLISYIENRMK